ncbi:hypothetical protein NKR23_g10717 [Pleurostoma richardsiae]|uniref:Uncharacterized protein n=1 Tax=Pleurostoma richardsiae TaxID=41990 RepID=A0AA38RCG7_9PEZI|nr:hypothetical protein NKR23_g10717 [Pleurostoma richardsiae]
MDMTASDTSSDSGPGGGAPLYSTPTTPQNTDQTSQESSLRQATSSSHTLRDTVPVTPINSSSGQGPVLPSPLVNGPPDGAIPAAPSAPYPLENPYYHYYNQYAMVPAQMDPLTGAIMPMLAAGYITHPLQGIPMLCQDAQARILALQQAVARQPGVTSQLHDMIGNDLRTIAHLFVSSQHLANQTHAQHQDEIATLHGEIAGLRKELDASRVALAKTQEELATCNHDSEEMQTGFTSYLEELKQEMKTMQEKIVSQTKAIEALTGIEPPPKAAQPPFSSVAPAYNPTHPTDLERRSETVRVTDNAESHRRNDSMPPPPALPPMNTSGGNVKRGLAQRLGGMNLHQVAGPNPMALQPYFKSEVQTPLMSHSFLPPGGDPRRFGLGPQPPLTPTPSYGFPRNPSVQTQRRVPSGPSAPATGPNNSLMLRRDDDSNNDPETKVWKDMFYKLFGMIQAWSQKYCSEVNEGSTRMIVNTHGRLWEYICSVTFPNDRRAAVSHAVYMLNNKDVRHYFITRLLLQYIQQNLLGIKVWTGFDPNSDKVLEDVDNKMHDITSVEFSQRKDHIEARRGIMAQMAASESFERFRQHKISEHATRFKDITGPLLDQFANRQEASLDLHSIANFGMEISARIMHSRLSFSFVWNECGIKFSQDMHIAMNNDTPAANLQFKQFRLMIVVTPSISYRDDTGTSIIPRCVTKAQVLVMH